MATIDYQPWYQHQTYPAISIPLTVGGVADNISSLTAANFEILLRNSTTGQDTTGVGTVTITTANPAVITYKFAPADVATAWGGFLVVVAFFPPSFAANDQAIWDPIPFVVTPA